jgi:hypothetical protein
MRRALIVIGALGLLVLGGWVTYLLAFRDTATPVDRADLTVATSGSAPGDPGVYVYGSSGYEAIDALTGARHDYPAETYLTITDGPCGPAVRWDALAERWISWDHCGPDLAVTRMQGLHQWFGVPDLEDEVCSNPLPLVPAAESTVACVAGATTETYRVTPLGPEPVLIGGEEVIADHVRIISELSGGSTGSSEADLWVYPGTVLVVKTTVERHTVTPSRVGDVHYDEEYTLLLKSMEPSP